MFAKNPFERFDGSLTSASDNKKRFEFASENGRRNKTVDNA